MKLLNKIAVITLSGLTIFSTMSQIAFANFNDEIDRHHQLKREFVDRNMKDQLLIQSRINDEEKVKKYQSNISQVGIIELPSSHGSGVVIDHNKVLTATHVVSNHNNDQYKPSSIKYRPHGYNKDQYSYDEYKPIKIKKVEQYKNTELTILTLKRDVKNIKPLKLSKDHIHYGDKLKMVGYHDTKNNKVKKQYTSEGKNIYIRKDLHQKDQIVIFNHMRSHKGMSGGPLLNEKNEVVGISSFLYYNSDLSGFVNSYQLNKIVN